MDEQIKVIHQTAHIQCNKMQVPYYLIILLDGTTQILIDGIPYLLNGQYVICATPYQTVEWQDVGIKALSILQFHGDFYCIAYHKKEVACNGVLFNNIYIPPYTEIPTLQYNELLGLMEKIHQLSDIATSYDHAIIKSYLQTILAISSKYKILSNKALQDSNENNHPYADFIALLEANFIQQRNISFYAAKYHLTTYTFSKHIKKHFGKTPTTLVQERVILEAKKLLHLTYKSIKEIAEMLQFDDEFYFSRYFKKYTGVAPKHFREQVGFSIVAK